MHWEVEGGVLAYEVTGEGPLIVLAHGIGDSRAAYRFVAPALAEAGYRVASVDLRGCGASSAELAGYEHREAAQDLIGLVRHLGGPAVLVGNSYSGGAVTIAASLEPALVTALVEVAPFTRAQNPGYADWGVARFRRGMSRLLGVIGSGDLDLWRGYLEIAYPGRRPADWDARLAEIDAMLREPGRMNAFQEMAKATPADAGEQLGNLQCPVLVIEGSLDPDWADPRAEGEAIVAALPPGLGRLKVIEGAGHYPHVQFPEEVVASMLSLLADVHG
jgi:pimeloyl-ACP methyl ester carboxylesterase